METPFAFGKIVSGKEFTDREKETDKLINNFKSGINTIILSPRRWGKSSLVAKAAKSTTENNPHVKFCFIDLYNVRDEAEFYNHYVQSIIKSTSSKTGEVFDTVKKFMGKFIPKISFGTDPINEFSIKLDWNEVIRDPDDILDLPEKISKYKNIRLVICLNEFQNIGEFKQPVYFQKKLRAHWQKHQKVSYCIYGSKKHMMLQVFSNPSLPFYKFGEIMFLNKIEINDWEKFIIKRFKDTKKEIDKETAELIASMVDCHSYYIQQLAQQCWLRTDKKCTKAIAENALEDLINQFDFLFQTITESLTLNQINFLKALINGVKQFSSKQTIDEYSLGTSASVNRTKKTLYEKEIIDTDVNGITILDPVYKLWLKRIYLSE